MTTLPGRKIHVLQLIKGLDIGGINGGAERFSVDLARALPKDRYDVTICVFFQQGTASEKYWHSQIERDGLPLFFLTEWAGNNHFDTYIRGLLALQKKLRKKPVDICHSHFQLGTISAIFLKLTGGARRALRTAHIIQEWEKGWYGWARRKILSNWIFPLTLDAEVGVSQAVVDDLSSHPGSKLRKNTPTLIYNAIEMDRFSSKSAGKQSPKDVSKPVIGTVGRLAEQKGHLYLLQAVKEALRVLPQLECWIVGDGELRGQLEEESRKLGLQENVLFLGRRDDVHILLHQMDLFVLPSLWEGLPTVLMESMMSGIPVLATDIPGTREMVENGVNGWLVPPKDSAQLAGRIVEILTNKMDCELVVERAYQSVNRFSMHYVAEKYHELYKRILH